VAKRQPSSAETLPVIAQAPAPAPKAHSGLVGGSSAGRLLACTASYRTLMMLPDTIETTSEYAEFGTHKHHVMDFLMRHRQENPRADLYTLASAQVGRHFYDRVLTKEVLVDSIEPALDHMYELEKIYGGGFKVVGVEKKVRFPNIPGAFGTADLFLESKKYLVLNDWKFGSGVPVKATYVVDDGEIVNPQLLFYLTAAHNTSPKLFANKKKLVVAITQPLTEDPLTHTVVDRIEMKHFTEDLENAVIEALSRNPRYNKGEHCRFAACKAICPLWTGPLIDLSALGVVRQNNEDAGSQKITAYGEYLAKAKYLLDLLLVMKPTIDEQMHSFMDEGGKIPGWKLKLKSKNRQWVDENVVVPALKELGFADTEIWQSKLQTFTSVDATAKRRGVVIPEHLRVAPITTETSIAADDDPAPKVDRAEAVRNFQATLQQLKASVNVPSLPKPKQIAKAPK
jgi:hypothetical protein